MLHSYEAPSLTLLKKFFQDGLSKRLFFPVGEMDELFLATVPVSHAEKHDSLILEGLLCCMVSRVWQVIPIDNLYTFIITEYTHKARTLWNSARNRAAKNWMFHNWLAEDLGCSFSFCPSSPQHPYLYICKEECIWNSG